MTPTLAIIRSTDGHVFGGYTDIAWKHVGGFKKENGNTFAFSVRPDGSVVKLNYLKEKEVDHEKFKGFNILCVFCISFEHMRDCSYFTQLGQNFERPNDPSLNERQSKFYLSEGKEKFQVEEIEVYHVHS